MHNLKWFTSRIGKRIYRNYSSCPCESCQEVNKNGLIIADILHAKALHAAQELYTYKDISLSNILELLKNQRWISLDGNFKISFDGSYFYSHLIRGSEDEFSFVEWNLKKDFAEQSKEVKDFFKDIIVLK